MKGRIFIKKILLKVKKILERMDKKAADKVMRTIERADFWKEEKR